MKKIFTMLIIGMLVFFTACSSTQTIPSIVDAQEEINKAEVKISESEEDGKEVELAKERLELAKSKLVEAQNALDGGDSQRADQLAEESKDFAAESRMKYIGKTAEDFE